MKYLLDTHLLLQAATAQRLSRKTVAVIEDQDNELIFSAASIWEVAIKSTMGRSDFRADPAVLRRGLMDSGYFELAVTADHAQAVTGLPNLHKDPFDRLLVAQALIEGVTLLTADRTVLQYPGPIESAL